MRLKSGVPWLQHYRDADPTGHLAGRMGICHAKWCLSDSRLAIGSTNWTTSSQCNVEKGVVLNLAAAGRAAVEADFDILFGESLPLESA